MHVVLTILIVALLAGIAIGLVLQHMLYSRLSAEHPKASEILAESSAGIMAFQRYLWIYLRGFRKQRTKEGGASLAAWRRIEGVV